MIFIEAIWMLQGVSTAVSGGHALREKQEAMRKFRREVLSERFVVSKQPSPNRY